MFDILLDGHIVLFINSLTQTQSGKGKKAIRVKKYRAERRVSIAFRIERALEIQTNNTQGKLRKREALYANANMVFQPSPG